MAVALHWTPNSWPCLGGRVRIVADTTADVDVHCGIALQRFQTCWVAWGRFWLVVRRLLLMLAFIAGLPCCDA